MKPSLRSLRLSPSLHSAAVAALCIVFTCAGRGFAVEPVPPTVHVWEKIELTFTAERTYDNPYFDVDVWVDLEGPGFRKRCYGFWDGGNVFRVRILATSPGQWRWTSGASTDDPGFVGKSGTFWAVPWTEAEKEAVPCRRGMIRPTKNGHALEWADGTPFFLLGDTWWATPTFRFPWRDDPRPRAIGPQAGFQDYLQYRRNQGFNALAIIVGFPNWTDDGLPARLKTEDGTTLRMAWKKAGTNLAKPMPNEQGHYPFLFPGKIPGYEKTFADVTRIDPRYFQALDRKIDYMNSQGFVPFMEVARRDVGQAWKRYYPWPESYVRYVRYVWSRYQANICIFSPFHFDSPAASLPKEEWNEVAKQVLATYGKPPFGTLCSTNASGSTLENWGHVDQAPWLTLHQIGNRRTHAVYEKLTEIFRASPPIPGLNGEPYYDGMLDAEPGSEKAARYCRSAAYGSVLSGGLAGHIYGAGGWQGGLWSGEVEPESAYPIWDVIRWPSADQMRHVVTFLFSEGDRYRDLVPCSERLSPSREGDPESCEEWAYCAATEDDDLILAYFEKGCRQAVLSRLAPGTRYTARWFDPRTGKWLPETVLTVEAGGTLACPAFPGNTAVAEDDWALKLTRYDSKKGENGEAKEAASNTLEAHKSRSGAPLSVSWADNRLTIEGDFPTDKIDVWYLEAFCRNDSHDRDWHETVIPHRTRLLEASPDKKRLHLQSVTADGVVVDHVITAGVGEVDFRVRAVNPTSQPSTCHWAQPCVRVGDFTGFGDDTTDDAYAYLSKCFVFIDGKPVRMPFSPWATEARYTPGQVWCPRGVPRTDVNPRPLSPIVPSNGLIGCFSSDEEWILATAWEPYQELFQGVIRCLHSDFRIGGLAPGQEKKCRGKIYILHGTIDDLLARYEEDFPEHVGDVP